VKKPVKPQDFSFFLKKYSILFASFRKYVYICTKNAAPRRSHSALPYALPPTRGAGFERRKKNEKKYNNLIFLLI